jgi:hypothetical protein
MALKKLSGQLVLPFSTEFGVIHKVEVFDEPLSVRWTELR